MNQVLHTMRLRLPATEAALTELRTLMQHPEGSTQRDRLDRLCAGRDPGEVLTVLEGFRDAVRAGKGLDAVPLWVKVAPLLKAVNG